MKINWAAARIFSLILFFCLFLLPSGVGAQSVGIQISPVKIEELVVPGQVLQESVAVKNISDTPKKMFINIRDFTSGDETGRPILLAPGEGGETSIASWVDFSTEGYEFAAGEEKVIPFQIIVPQDAGPGGYYGGVFFGTEPPRLDLNSEDRGAGMAVAQQNGTLLIFQVKGEIFEEAMVREFNTDKEFYNTPFDVNFTLRLENSGNIHVRPYGSIKISNMFGKEVGEIEVNQSGGNILPHSIRNFPDIVWSGKSGFGRYHAEMGLSYGISVDNGGQGKKSIVASKDFWIIPWKIVLPLLISLFVVIALFVLLVRLYKNKAVKRAMEQMGLVHTRRMNSQPSPTKQLFIIFLIVFIVVFAVMSMLYFMFFS